MSAGGPQPSMHDSSGMVPLDDCPFCLHPRASHEELHPTNGVEIDPGIHLLACTEHWRDPVTGEESFCDCLWDTEADPGA